MRRVWQHARPSDPKAFAEQVDAVCAAYRQAAELHQEEVRGISTDEMSSIQALKRLQPTRPTRPGRVEKREQHYRRHGTQTLIGTFEVTSGMLILHTVRDRRSEADFAAHVAATPTTDPEAGWMFLVDDLDIHQSASLVQLVASACGLTEDLGLREKRGGC